MQPAQQTYAGCGKAHRLIVRAASIALPVSAIVNGPQLTAHHMVVHHSLHVDVHARMVSMSWLLAAALPALNVRRHVIVMLNPTRSLRL